MKLDLPSGNWIEMRGADQLNAGDRTAMHSAVSMPVNTNQIASATAAGFGMTNVSLGMIEDQNYAVLSRLITGWSYPMCKPREDVTEGYEDSLKQIPLDDWDVIEDTLAPIMAKLRATPKGRATTTASSNGTSKDAEALQKD